MHTDIEFIYLFVHYYSLKVRLIFKILSYWENRWHSYVNLQQVGNKIYKCLFCMKYRKKFSKTMKSSTIWNKYAFKLEKYTALSLMRGNYSNYVHLLVGAEPKYYPSIVMQIIKGITPRNIFKE